jgi:hypothetical protein
MPTERQEFCERAARLEPQEACFEWPYKLMTIGYGCLRIDNILIYAHRHVCELAHGPAPFEGAVVAHKCGNRSCVNPDHLKWCTQAENIADKWAHGTMQRGSTCPHSKIGEDDAAEIRRSYEAGEMSQAKLAKKFGISPAQIGRIVRAERWVSAEPGAENAAPITSSYKNPSGSLSPMSELDERDVLEIRALLAQGVRGAVLARRFGVSATTISGIKKRKTWRHI